MTLHQRMLMATAGRDRQLSDIGGLYFLADAQDTGSITKDGSDLVSQWLDLAGGRHLTQSGGTEKPTYVSSGINSLPALHFTAGPHYMVNASFDLPQPFTAFVVAQIDGNGSPPKDYLFDGTTNRAAMAMNTPTGTNFGIFAGTELGAAHTHGAAHVYAGVFNGASSSVYIDGVLHASGAAGSSRLRAIKVGERITSVSTALNGYIGLIAFYNRALSTDEIADVQAILERDWGF